MMIESRAQSSDQQHKTCFGTMFPDALRYRCDQVQRGKVFSFLLASASGVSRSERRVQFDVAQWDDCRACPEFESCYQLSLGAIALESVVVTE
jgi:hypothetical protein